MRPPDTEPATIGAPGRRGQPARLLAPREPEDPPAGSLPILASIAPVAGSCALFAITGSPVTLVFAALGPLIAIAGFVDARWTKRRRGRRARAAYLVATNRLEADIARSHAAERTALETLHPAGRALELLAASDQARWRAPEDRRTMVVLGRGEAVSSLRVEGAAGDVRWADAARLADAPIVVDAAEGIGIVAGPVLARAVGRSVVLQLARQHPPETAAFHAEPGAVTEPDRADCWSVLGRLPHRDDPAGAADVSGPREGAPVRVSVIERWGTAPEVSERLTRRPSPGGVLIALADTVELIPARCRHLLVLGGDGEALLADGTGASTTLPIAPTLLAEAEAEHLAAVLAEAALTTGESALQSRLATSVTLAEVQGTTASSSAPSAWRQDALRVAVGIGTTGPLPLDLGRDGPHALVGGTTGSGKSELLITWIVALAGQCSPEELSFLLIDCKGGASFQAVAALPHVVGMVTDLEPTAADRVVSSLRAELRHRERVLARHGARHLLDPELLPEHRPARLVVVVDEFQALLDASPHLHQVFADLASRGRSLGLHLILCSQRPAAVAADAILANCTLRLSLRVTSRPDSVAILGVPDAAHLPAGAAGRCIVWDGELRTAFQVAVTTPDDLLAVQRRWRGVPTPRRPWLDPLPERLPLGDLGALERYRPSAAEAERAPAPLPEDIVFGLADLPEEQTQRPAVWNPTIDGSMLVLGAGRTGRTTLLDVIATQAAGRWRIERVDHDPEEAWDTIMALADPVRIAGPTLLLIDDVESVLATAGDEHGAALREALLTLLRDGGRRGIRVVVVASRLGGVVHRLSAQLDRTLVLRLADRQDHLVAGAPAACFDQRRPPGRAYWDDAEVQIALPAVSPVAAPGPAPTADHWRPAPGTTTVLVTRAARAARALLQRSARAGERIQVIDPVSDHAPQELHGDGFRAPEVLAPLAAAATVVVVDPESWLSGRLVAGRDLPATVARADLVVHACSAADLRQLTRSRELPPLLGYGPARAWWWRPGQEVRRVDLLGESG